MKKLLVFALTVVVSAVFAADDGSDKTWQNHGSETQRADANEFSSLTLRLAPTKTIPPRSTVVVSQVSLASVGNGQDARLMRILDGTTTIADSSPVVTNGTMTAGIGEDGEKVAKSRLDYSFAGLSMEVGKPYSVAMMSETDAACSAEMMCVDVGNALQPLVYPSQFASGESDYAVVCEITATNIVATSGDGVPKYASHSYSFNGSTDSEGVLALNFGDSQFSYVSSSKAFDLSKHPSGDRLTFGPDDWTIVVNAKIPAEDGQILLSLGSSTTNNLVAIVSTGDDSIMVLYDEQPSSNWPESLIPSDSYEPISVPGASSSWHSYALVHSGQDSTLTLYVDGESKGSSEPYEMTTSRSFCFGSVHSGLGATELDPAASGAVNDFKVYDSALSESALAALHSTFITTEYTASIANAVDWSAISWDDDETWVDDGVRSASLTLTDDATLAFDTNVTAAAISIATAGHNLGIQKGDDVSVTVGSSFSVTGGGAFTSTGTFLVSGGVYTFDVTTASFAAMEIVDGSSLVFSGWASGTPIVLGGAPTFDSGKVYVSLGDGGKPVAGATLMSWPEGTAPAGKFCFADSPFFGLVTTSTGVVFERKSLFHISIR